MKPVSGRQRGRAMCGPDMKAMVGAGVSSGRKSTPSVPKFAAGGAAKVRRGVATPAGKPKSVPRNKTHGY